MTNMIVIKDDVRQALDNNIPVVALESTIISHGLPYPANNNMAKEVEDIIRSEGAVPATIAVIGGVIKVGLDRDDLEILSTSKDVLKLSKRDIAYAVSTKRHGATTVSATMVIAHMAGIRVFATGGIGGVHRGAETTFDISRDLREFETAEVLVVTAGAKAILDLPKTLEVLETNGVDVIGFKTDAFPAFFSPDSGLKAPLRLDTVEDVARLMKAKWGLGLSGGIVLANPIPDDDAIGKSRIESIIEASVHEAALDGITGKETTPYLLSKIVQKTGGDSLTANLALVRHNAHVAARIAKAYSTQQ
jgi:pseudouridine-5'-phosphate glycosidase